MKLKWITKPGRGLISGLIGLIMAAIGGVAVFPILTEAIDELPEDTPSVVTALIDILPYVFATTILLGAFAYISGDEDTVVVGPIKHYVRIKRWDQFGTRLKVAYKAKFGYANPGFDQRVDELILSMRATSNKSLTYKQNEDALKRLSKFVEVRFSIPEEGKWSEEEKTRILHREYHEKYNVPLPKVLKDDPNYIPWKESKIAQAQVKASDGFAQLGQLAGLAIVAAASEQQPERRCFVETSCSVCDSWGKDTKKCLLDRIRAVANPPEYKPDAGYEEETYKVEEAPVLQSITYEEIGSAVPGEFANEPTPKMTPKPRRSLWKRVLRIKEEEKVPVRRSK